MGKSKTKRAPEELWLSTEKVKCCMCKATVTLCVIDDEGWSVTQCYCARARSEGEWCYHTRGNTYCNKCCLEENAKSKAKGEDDYYTALPLDEWKERVACNHRWIRSEREAGPLGSLPLALQDRSETDALQTRLGDDRMLRSGGSITRNMALSLRPADTPPRCASAPIGSPPERFANEISSGSMDDRPRKFDLADDVYDQITEIRRTQEAMSQTLQTVSQSMQTLRKDLNETLPGMQKAITETNAKVKHLEEKVAFLSQNNVRLCLEERVAMLESVLSDVEKEVKAEKKVIGKDGKPMSE